MPEFADVFETGFRKKRLNRRNSLHFSLRPGNFGLQETVKSIRGKPPRRPTVGDGACSKNPHHARERSSSGKRPPGNKRPIRHCERVEAIQGVSNCGLAWIASLSLAMTGPRYLIC